MKSRGISFVSIVEIIPEPTMARPRNTKKRDRATPSPQREQHLERNRTAANKYRQKKKKEQESIDNQLHSETEKRELLLSQVHILQKEVWDLKTLIFQHAGCEHHPIDLPPSSTGRFASSDRNSSSQQSQTSYRTESSRQ